MMPRVVSLLWHERRGERLSIFGMLQRPKTVNRAEYQAEYALLINEINQLLRIQG
jgi:hypothetical protein